MSLLAAELGGTLAELLAVVDAIDVKQYTGTQHQCTEIHSWQHTKTNQLNNWLTLLMKHHWIV